MKKVSIWTDGSGDNKKGNGGFGIVLTYREEEILYQSDQYINTTSARMEIKALLEALRLVCDKSTLIKLYCDNQYVCFSISKNWAEKWEKENWNNRKNKDLWIQVLEEIRKFKHKPQIIWVKGHNGDEYNEICDILAGEARKSEIIIDDSVK
jgi:ribonuclease HI